MGTYAFKSDVIESFGRWMFFQFINIEVKNVNFGNRLFEAVFNGLQKSYDLR